MTWKIRHEGSPQAVEGQSLEDILHGLADGNWEPTDEVLGPDDKTWRKLEEHPQFAEIAAELEPPPPRTYGDEEAHVDMNALIDVCMVLLIFFILTTSYAKLQSRMKSPDVAADDDKAEAVRLVGKEEEDQSIKVVVALENGKPVIDIMGKRVTPNEVEAELKKIVRGSKKTSLLLDVDSHVPVKWSVPIERDAAAAGVQRIARNLREK